MKAIIAVPETVDQGCVGCCFENLEANCPDFNGSQFPKCAKEKIIYKIVELEDNKEGRDERRV